MSKSFQQGWQYFVKASGVGLSANSGQNYCAKVESAIEIFTEEMYKMVYQHGQLPIGQCKGFVAETWHANTFNIDAALHSSSHRAFVNRSTELGSVDVSTNFGKDFSMKYIGSAKKSVNAQAKNYYEKYHEYLKQPRKGMPMSFDDYLQKYGLENNPEDLLKSIYSGQYRVIPKEQLDEAIKHIETLMKVEQGKDGVNRFSEYANYVEILKKLTDKVFDDEGIESIPLDKESAETIVKLCKEGKFKVQDFGIDLPSLVTNDYIIQQALKTGYTSAVMSIVMETAPQICEAIFLLIKDGKIYPKQLKEIGFAAVRGSSLGFIRGYVSCALAIACQSGKLGKQFIDIQGNAIAAITVLVMDTVKNAWFVASGKMCEREMAIKTEDAAIVTISALIGGSIGTVLLPQLTVLGYLIGSFVGSVFGSVIAEGKNSLIIALCANTGITLFGLVEQDYSLSKEMIKRLGLSVVDLKNVQPKNSQLNYNQVNTIKLRHNKPKSIEIFTLRRGVIGVRKVGYI